MSDPDLVQALDRAERAMSRIERAMAERPHASKRDDELRARVREVVSELDSIIAVGGR